MKEIKITETQDPEYQEDLDRASDGEEIERMMATPGWKIVESLLKDQLEAYVADNATSAKDWNDYLEKSGKIFGIRLLLTDLDDYVRQGQEAKERIAATSKDRTRP